MQEVASLVTRDQEPKIVVLSALSGTTNALVEISNSLATGDRHRVAKQQIDALFEHYKSIRRCLRPRGCELFDSKSPAEGQQGLA